MPRVPPGRKRRHWIAAVLLGTTVGFAPCVWGESPGSSRDPTPPAWSRFQVVGISPTHIALRELYDIAEHGKLAPCAYRLSPRSLGEHGVRLYVLPYKEGLFLPVVEGGGQRFPIYDSVTRETDCTPRPLAESRLHRAKAAARDHGIVTDARLTALSLGTLPVAAEACLRGEGGERAAACDATFQPFSPLLVHFHLETQLSESPGDDSPTQRLTAALTLRDETTESRVSTSIHGTGLTFEPIQLYRFDGRAVLLALFRESPGREQARFLVVKTPAPVLLSDEGVLLAPLVMQQQSAALPAP